MKIFISILLVLLFVSCTKENAPHEGVALVKIKGYAGRTIFVDTSGVFKDVRNRILK